MDRTSPNGNSDKEDKLASCTQHTEGKNMSACSREHTVEKNIMSAHCCGKTPTEDVHEVPLALPNLFGHIRERNLAICIDTSGSMYGSLDAVKEHLCEFLANLARHPLPTSFNLIEFSTEVTQWSDELVACTPHTVAVATEWIRRLQAKTGTNTLEALTAALADDKCDAVVLVTDGLPDQNPADILDQVALVGNDRPVHCYYIRNGLDPDELSVEFLQDLATETYGSLHIIAVAQHGAIERITPVYCSHAAAGAGGVIRTTQGTVYPAGHKECSVSTTLDAPVEYVVDHHHHHPADYYVVETETESAGCPVASCSYHPICSYYPSVLDSRYYYSYYYPYQGWSRYRQAKAWPRKADRIIEVATAKHLPPHISPGPGALLVDTVVLARRYEDGYFYKGKVKSEIFEKKFLVQFEPCQHGRFRETSYQEIFIYDLIALDDALRHSVLVGDKVLAPWEPGSQRYAPGTVIEGQERRSADIGAGSDENVVVSFDHDGKSVRLPRDQAVWVPPPLHERVAFELKLPAKVRREIATTTDDYPLHSLPGYPRSGLERCAPEYDRFEEVVVERQGGKVLEKGLYRSPYFVPLYPVHFKKTAAAAVKSDAVEAEELIPGTGLTKEQLNEKVIEQLLNHKMLLEEIRRDQTALRQRINGETDGKLLSRRDNLDATTTSGKKSVSFTDDVKLEAETKDSGHGGSVTDRLSDLDLSDFDFDDDEPAVRDAATGTDAPLVSRRRQRRRRKCTKMPPWKYWGNDPAPSLLESNNFGRYRYGPFRDCMLAPPIEAKLNQSIEGVVSDPPRSKQVTFNFDSSQQAARRSVPSVTDLTPGVLLRIEQEKQGGSHDGPWTSPMSRVVDSTAIYRREPSVRDSMGYLPHPPPSGKPEQPEKKQGPGVDISIQIGAQDASREEKVIASRNNRRQRIIEREQTWEQRRTERQTNQELMRQQHRERILGQIKQDWQRAKDERDGLQAAREAKRAASAQLRARVEEAQAATEGGEQRRIEALRARREQLERRRAEHQTDKWQQEQTKQVARERGIMQYWARVNSERLEKERQQEAQDAAKRAAQVRRIQHFRDLEAQGQAKKLRQNQVIEQRNAMMHSSIFT